MEENLLIKKCDFCKGDATSLCYKCMFYFCDSCFQISHKNEETKSHTKEKIDYFCPIDIRCPIHKLYPNELFCINEKGKLNIFNIDFILSIMLSFMLI